MLTQCNRALYSLLLTCLDKHCEPVCKDSSVSKIITCKIRTLTLILVPGLFHPTPSALGNVIVCAVDLTYLRQRRERTQDRGCGSHHPSVRNDANPYTETLSHFLVSCRCCRCCRCRCRSHCAPPTVLVATFHCIDTPAHLRRTAPSSSLRSIPVPVPVPVSLPPAADAFFVLCMFATTTTRKHWRYFP